MPMLSRLSVRRQLILTTVSAWIVVLTVVGFLAHQWNAAAESSKIDAFLIADSTGSANAIATALAESDDTGESKGEVLSGTGFREYLATYFRNRLNRPAIYKTTMAVTDASGTVIRASNDALPVTDNELIAPVFRVTEKTVQEDGTILETIQKGGTVYRLVIMPLRRGDEAIGSIRLACLLTPAIESTLAFDRTLVALLAAIGLFTLLGSAILVTRTLRPVNDMRLAAERITEKNLDVRLPEPPGNDEIANLARTFNSLLHRIGEAYDFQVRVVDDLSHQLRTPLTILRGTIDLALRRETDSAGFRSVLEDSLADIDHMSSFLLTMLNLARLESRSMPLNLVQTDIAAEVADLVSDMEPLWSENGQKVSVETEGEAGGIALTVDRVLVNQAIMNILSNACKYCPRGGMIGIKITMSHESCVITIANSGPSIPENELHRIFERFYRGSPDPNSCQDAEARVKAEEGFGLGLNIAKNIVELHNGGIRAYNPASGGTAFEITLPRSKQEGA